MLERELENISNPMRMMSNMTDEMNFAEIRALLGQETYVDFLEWKLSHTSIDLDDLDNEIRIYNKLNGHLEVKALLIGSYYASFTWDGPQRKTARLKRVNSHYAQIYRSSQRSEATAKILWTEMHLNWVGKQSGTVTLP